MGRLDDIIARNERDDAGPGLVGERHRVLAIVVIAAVLIAIVAIILLVN